MGSGPPSCSRTIRKPWLSEYAPTPDGMAARYSLARAYRTSHGTEPPAGFDTLGVWRPATPRRAPGPATGCRLVRRRPLPDSGGRGAWRARLRRAQTARRHPAGRAAPGTPSARAPEGKVPRRFREGSVAGHTISESTAEDAAEIRPRCRPKYRYRQPRDSAERRTAEIAPGQTGESACLLRYGRDTAEIQPRYGPREHLPVEADGRLTDRLRDAAGTRHGQARGLAMARPLG